jgi:hypothetical protein
MHIIIAVAIIVFLWGVGYLYNGFFKQAIKDINDQISEENKAAFVRTHMPVFIEELEKNGFDITPEVRYIVRKELTRRFENWNS